MSKINAWLTRTGLRRIELWAQAGYSDKEISSLMAISRKTFYQWLKNYPQINDSVKRGRAHAADVVEDELFKRAQNQTIRLTKYVKLRYIEYDPVTGRKQRAYDELAPAYKEVFIPADVRAQMFFLKCRRPEDWGAERVVEPSGKATEALPQITLTLDERKVLLDEMKAVADNSGKE